jgi:hypothetical protein
MKNKLAWNEIEADMGGQFLSVLSFDGLNSETGFETVTIDRAIELDRLEVREMPFAFAKQILNAACEVNERESKALLASDLQDWQAWKAS